MTSRLVRLEFSDRCAVCSQLLDEDAMFIPETHVPGLENDGNPTRIVGYHACCAPSFVCEYNERLDE